MSTLTTTDSTATTTVDEKGLTVVEINYFLEMLDDLTSTKREKPVFQLAEYAIVANLHEKVTNSVAVFNAQTDGTTTDVNPDDGLTAVDLVSMGRLIEICHARNAFALAQYEKVKRAHDRLVVSVKQFQKLATEATEKVANTTDLGVDEGDDGGVVESKNGME